MSKLVKFNDLYVSELKLRYIENLYNICKDTTFIRKVILFGSVLEERCEKSSDIDLIIVGNISKSKCLDSKSYRDFCSKLFSFDFSQDYDIIYTNSLNKLSLELQENIERGCILFEK